MSLAYYIELAKNKILENLKGYSFENYNVLMTIALLCCYCLYFKKYRHYIYRQKENQKEYNKKSKGKCPPFFPNGWYKILDSQDLKINAVCFIAYCGRDTVVYRGTNNRVYALQVTNIIDFNQKYKLIISSWKNYVFQDICT